jgi:hypothetical protein
MAHVFIPEMYIQSNIYSRMLGVLGPSLSQEGLRALFLFGEKPKQEERRLPCKFPPHHRIFMLRGVLSERGVLLQVGCFESLATYRSLYC